MGNKNNKNQGLFGRNQAGTQMTDDELIAKQPSGSRFVKNEITVLGGQYSGLMHSGRSVTVSGDGVIPVPINATLGDENYNGTMGGNNTVTMTDLGGGDWNAVGTASGTSSDNAFKFFRVSNIPTGVFAVRFNARVNSGRFIASSYYNGSTVIGIDPVELNGYVEIIVENIDYLTIMFYQADSNLEPYDIDFLDITIKEVQSVQGSVTVFDGAAKEFVQETNLPLSTTYDLTDGIYGVICVLHTSVFSQDDITFFTSNPEAVLEWALGTNTIPSGITFGADDRIYFPVNDAAIEYRELNYETTGEKINVEGTATYNTRTNYGIQNIRLELNQAGVPVSVLPLGLVNGEPYIYIGYKLYPSDGYTVEETLTINGETNVWAWTSDGSIFKDGVPYRCYDLPAEGTLLQLEGATLDGQTVEKREETKVWTLITDDYIPDFPCTGYPLESLDQWTLVGNETPHVNSRVGYYDFGKGIVFNVWTTDTGVMNLSCCKSYTGRLSGYIDAYPDPASVTWCMPFSKMIDANNIVGARQNGANIEINTRVGGTWDTIASVANSETGHWVVEITDVSCKVFINGVLKLEADHTISGEGDFGISSHKVEEEFKIRDYSATVL